MGGRRAHSIEEVVGTGKRISDHARELKKALVGGDAGSVAESSAGMIARSRKVDDTFYYASMLIGFIRKTVKEGKALSHDERQKLARKAWSQIKKKEKLQDDPIVTKAIVSAAARALGGRKK